MDKSTADKLAYIKYIVNFGVEQANKVEPFFALSIPIFHDAIEIFCRLAMEYKEVEHDRKKELSLNDYWEILGLKNKETMRRFNKARVNFKHYGNKPSRIDMPDFIKFVTDFFEKNTTILFNIKFSELSLVLLIQNDDAREKLCQAENMLKKNNIEECLVNSALAFCHIMRDCDDKGIEIGNNLSFHSIRDLSRDYNYRSFIAKLQSWTKSVEEILKINILGIDYRKYKKFRSLTPYIGWALDGSYTYDGGWWYPRDYPKLNDAKFCINFVVESALKIQNIDFDEYEQ